jgi:transcriptional regulator with XRE-family HTH domain
LNIPILENKIGIYIKKGVGQKLYKKMDKKKAYTDREKLYIDIAKKIIRSRWNYWYCDPNAYYDKIINQFINRYSWDLMFQLKNSTEMGRQLFNDFIDKYIKKLQDNKDKKMEGGEFQTRRQTMGISQKDFADYFGVKSSQIAQIENRTYFAGKTNIDRLEQLEKLFYGTVKKTVNVFIELEAKRKNEKNIDPDFKGFEIVTFEKGQEKIFYERHPEYKGLPVKFHSQASFIAQQQLKLNGIDVPVKFYIN